MSSRINRRERYQVFFDRLLVDLQYLHHGVPWRFVKHNPGWNWMAFDGVKYNIWYGVGFTRDRRLRVDLHIQDKTLDRTMELFDALQDRGEAIEKKLGFSIEWESPPPGGLSGRLAVYRDGYIENHPDYLEELKVWAAHKVIALHTALTPHLEVLVD